MTIEYTETKDMVDKLDADEPPSMAVVTAVAKATDQSALEMDPLGESIDADALDALLETTDNSNSSTTVTFSYCGCQVTVTAEGIRID